MDVFLLLRQSHAWLTHRGGSTDGVRTSRTLPSTTLLHVHLSTQVLGPPTSSTSPFGPGVHRRPRRLRSRSRSPTTERHSHLHPYPNPPGSPVPDGVVLEPEELIPRRRYPGRSGVSPPFSSLDVRTETHLGLKGPVTTNLVLQLRALFMTPVTRSPTYRKDWGP